MYPLFFMPEEPQSPQPIPPQEHTPPQQERTPQVGGERKDPPQQQRQEPPTPQPAKPPQEEKQEFLKRDDIRTMGKDIVQVRRQEAQQQREKISQIGGERRIPLQQPPPPQPSLDPRLATPDGQENIPLPTPPSKTDKTLVRTIIIGIVLIILINAGALGYWFWRGGQTQPPVVPAPVASADRSLRHRV